MNMEMNPSRISLRPYELSDVDDFMIYAGDDKVTRFTRWNTFTSKEEALKYIKELCIPHPWRRSICLENRSIGFISITPGSNEERCKANIGYAIAAKYWGQGIASIAVTMALSCVFKEFPYLVRLQALVDLDNKASQRVLEKVGFLKEGVLRKYIFLKDEFKDLVMYSVLSTDALPNCKFGLNDENAGT